MTVFKKITDNKITTALFLLCWMAYFTSYIGRINYSSAMVYMMNENLLTASGAGLISMVYFFAYGSGQLLNGILGDKFHPGKMIFTGLLVASCANLAMGFCNTHILMVVFWGINGYAQSMIWPPIIRIFSEMLNEDKKLKYCINIVTSQVGGTLASYMLSALSIRLFGWRSVFVSAAVCLCAVAVLWQRGFGKVERYSMEYGEEPEKSGTVSDVEESERLGTVSHVEESERLGIVSDVEESEKSGTVSDIDKPKKNEVKEKSGLIAFFITAGLLPVIFPDMIHGMLKDGMTSWVPTYISETFHVTSVTSILATMILPVISMTGAYLAKYVYLLCGKKELKAASCFFLAAVLGLLGLRTAGSFSIMAAVILFACITASMMAVNTIFINLIPIQFERLGKVSTVSGFLNAMSYMGTAISTYGIGLMAEHLGWNATINTWIILTVAALVICLVYRKKSFGFNKNSSIG